MTRTPKVHARRNTGRAYDVMHCGRYFVVEMGKILNLDRFDEWLRSSDACKSCVRSYRKWQREGPK